MKLVVLTWLRLDGVEALQVSCGGRQALGSLSWRVTVAQPHVTCHLLRGCGTARMNSEVRGKKLIDRKNLYLRLHMAELPNRRNVSEAVKG